MSHPERTELRPCRLAFSSKGVVLLARNGRPVLRVPWWAVEGFSADGTGVAPGGRRLQVVALVTPAGSLELLCPACEVGTVLSSLAGWEHRWRAARSPWLGRGLRALSVATSSLRRQLPPARRLVARRWISIASVGLALGAWTGVMVTGAGGAGGAPVTPAPKPVSSVSTGFDASGMAQIIAAAEFQAGVAANLAPATAPPPPAPPSVTAEPPLRSHEVFGFAPYWDLAQEGTIDVAAFTTLSYFAVAANADGTLQESGTGWDGFQSQDFADLVARAHAAGDRVVLTVNCFTQAALDKMTSSSAAAGTLASQIVAAVAAKNLDGVNLDLEGQGPADQAGLTALVGIVAQAVHAANPHYQVTMDTYASAAGDPGGFYDIRALAPLVDGFFVMAYNLNLSASASAGSPITSAELSDAAAAAEYAAAVPPSKVVFGLPWFGYTWPTTDGTMAATAMGTPVPESYGQVAASGEPVYWDGVTDTAWTSYEVGDQWYETYFEDPASVYRITQLAVGEGFAGVGAWALGMDGGDPQMAAALDGNAPPVRAGPAGPASTSESAGAGAGSAPPPVPPSLPGVPGLPGMPGVPGVPGLLGVPSAPTTTTTAPALATPAPSPSGISYRYTGTFDGQAVTLETTPARPTGTPSSVGTLDDFATTDPSLSCLASPTTPPLEVWQYPGSTVYVVTARQPTWCAAAVLTFSIATAGTGVVAGAGAGTGAGGTVSAPG